MEEKKAQKEVVRLVSDITIYLPDLQAGSILPKNIRCIKETRELCEVDPIGEKVRLEGKVCMNVDPLCWLIEEKCPDEANAFQYLRMPETIFSMGEKGKCSNTRNAQVQYYKIIRKIEMSLEDYSFLSITREKLQKLTPGSYVRREGGPYSRRDIQEVKLCC